MHTIICVVIFKKASCLGMTPLKFPSRVNPLARASAILALVTAKEYNKQAWKGPPTPYGSDGEPKKQACAIATFHHRFAARQIET